MRQILDGCGRARVQLQGLLEIPDGCLGVGFHKLFTQRQIPQFVAGFLFQKGFHIRLGGRAFSQHFPGLRTQEPDAAVIGTPLDGIGKGLFSGFGFPQVQPDNCLVHQHQQVGRILGAYSLVCFQHTMQIAGIKPGTPQHPVGMGVFRFQGNRHLQACQATFFLAMHEHGTCRDDPGCVVLPILFHQLFGILHRAWR